MKLSKNKCKTVTAICYAGGKSKVVKNLLSDYFPQESFETYHEPFFGGGSVGLFIKQMYPNSKCSINDLSEKLINFWINVRDNSDDMINALHIIRDEYNTEETERGKELLSNMNYQLEHGNNFERAIAYYVLNKIAFSGLTENNTLSKHNYVKKYNHTNIDKLKFISCLIADFEMFNLDFVEYFKKIKPKDFTFLDPPYMIENDKLYGKNGDLHSGFNHYLFFDEMKKMPGKWVLTYNDNEIIRETFKDFNIYDAQYRYCLAHKKNEAGGKETILKNELIITNFKGGHNETNYEIN